MLLCAFSVPWLQAAEGSACAGPADSTAMVPPSISAKIVLRIIPSSLRSVSIEEGTLSSLAVRGASAAGFGLRPAGEQERL
jgi:hypothetical protein